MTDDTPPVIQEATVLIRHILRRKGSDVATTSPETTVADATTALRDHNIGALVVTSPAGDEVVGILSERDIVRGLASRGPAVLDRPVSDIMSSELTTCSHSSTVDELMRLMTDRRIRHIPVMDGDELTGIVSIGDVVKSRIDELQVETETLHEYLTTGRS